MAEQYEIRRLGERVARLEEGQGFSERAAEGMSAEVYALGKRVDEVSRRLERLESAIRSVIRQREEEGPSAGDEE